MAPQYNICVAEGIRYIIGQYGDVIALGKLIRFEYTPSLGGGAARKYTPLFDFYIPEGYWDMARYRIFSKDGIGKTFKP